MSTMDTPLRALVVRAQGGDVGAFGQLVEATQAMTYSVAWSVLRDRAGAADATQDAYLRAYRRLGDLQDPDAFPGWLRRIVVTTALNERRSRRHTFLRLDDVEVPVLDEAESSWSEAQRHRLAAALVTLSREDRQLCDRRYHGRWSVARLAAAAGIDEAAMRKRLQRVRDKLRKEIEMTELRAVPPGELPESLPVKVAELLARPRLTELPENPVGRIVEQLRSVFPDFLAVDLPEVVDLESARSIAATAMYVDPKELHRVDDTRILRYDLTLPLLLQVRCATGSVKAWAAGKVYRVCQVDSTHLEAFHQAEAFWLEERSSFNAWHMTGRVLQSADRVLPGRALKIVPTEYPMCSQAWELQVEEDGGWVEVLAWGVFTDTVVRQVGGDPARHTAAGAGYGLERLAMIRYGIDDVRKVDVASVA